jgi:hypothetical protein
MHTDLEVTGMVISLVHFKSRLSPEAVRALYEERADRYREVPGLLEKIYLRFPETGESGAVYLWESKEALESFRASELSGTIADAYQVEERPTSELAEVVLIVDNRAGRVIAS